MPQSIGATSPHLRCVLQEHHIIMQDLKTRDKFETHLNPQSSHSSTGLNPSLLPHKSHFAASALEKKNPNGLQICPSEPGLLGSPFSVVDAPLTGLPGARAPAGVCLFAPGFIKVNRWMNVFGAGAALIVDMPSSLIELPSVAAATEIEDDAV